MAPLLLAVSVGAVLLALWWGATRRHVHRRDLQSADWTGTSARPDLWTSSARCPNCGAAGGVLDAHDGELWFTCLSCRSRHRREHKA